MIRVKASRYVLAVAGLLVCATMTFADEPLASEEDIVAFNNAWTDYTTQMQDGDTEAQVTSAKAALDAGRKIFSESDERLPLLLTNYGALLNAADRRDEAQGVLQNALQLAEVIYGEDAYQLTIVLAHLADAHAGWDGEARQLKYYTRALDIAAGTHGKDSVEYASLALRTGSNVYNLSHSLRGRKYLHQATDYFSETAGDESFEAAIGRYYLAKLAFSRYSYKQASTYLLAALPGFAGEDANAVEYQMYARALLVEALEHRNMTEEATEHCIAIGKLSPLRAKTDYEPLFRMAPLYPSDMLARGKEGKVDFEFTIDANGIVRNPKITNEEREYRGFEEAALAAVERFRYAPQVVDGKPVAVEGIETRITFALE